MVPCSLQVAACYHAADFSVYAHLQLAQDIKAKALIEKSLATPARGDRPSGFGNFMAKAAMETRYLLDRGDWAGAAAMPMNVTGAPMADSIYRFARGLATRTDQRLAASTPPRRAVELEGCRSERLNPTCALPRAR